MTTMTLKIDDKREDLVEAFKTLASNFKGVSYEIEQEETQEEVLRSLRVAMKGIKSGDMVKNAISSEDFFKKFAND